MEDKVMKEVREITDFMERVEKDPRLGPMHISLYLAILFYWLRQGGAGPAIVSGRQLMPLSKIGGPTPMYKYLRELHAFGYIVYQPSMSPKGKTRVYLPLLETMGYQWKG
jgi:hypothetical protein